MKCTHLTEEGDCMIATTLHPLKNPVGIELGACRACRVDPYPMQPNKITISLAITTIPPQQADQIIQQYAHVFLNYGLGTELHLVLQEDSYLVEEGCNCNKIMSDLNRLGLDATKQDIDLVAQEMAHEFQKRKLTILGINPPFEFLVLGAKRYIYKAIRRYRKKCDTLKKSTV